MWKILLLDFIGDLKTQKLRAFLTFSAIAWGTIAVVLMLAFGEGLKRTMLTGMLNAGDKVFIVYPGRTNLPHEGLPRGRPIRLTEDDRDFLLRTVPDLDMASVSYMRFGVTYQNADQRVVNLLEGVTPEFEEMRRMYPVAGGRFVNTRDVEQRRRSIFLGDTLAQRLFGGESGVGRTVLVDGLPFTVVGTMQSKMQTSMNNGPDSHRAVIPAATFRTIYGNRFVNNIVVRPRDVTRAESTKREIYEALGRRHGFDPEDSRALGIWDFVEQERVSRKIFLGIQIFLGVIGGMTLFVAGVGVANIMYVVVHERTHEIGVKLALGARKRHIMSQFIFEALTISLAGGLFGLAVAAAVVLGVDGMPSNGNQAMEFLANPKLSWPIGWLTVGILAGIGLISGILPARRAANLDPVESLRYE